MSTTPAFRDESHFRETLKRTLDRVENAFDSIDPDVAECTNQFGALAITFADGQKCILSAQPSVQQLWMAVASRGIAFHFDYDSAGARWVDDKGKGIELYAYLEQFLSERIGRPFAFPQI